MNGACPPCLEHLQKEHHRLNHELLGVQHELADLIACQEWPLPAELIERLRGLRSELAAHFQEEECGGCLEEAVSRAPSTSPQVRQIEAEHRELLPALDRTIEAAASPTGSPAGVVQDFADFVARIHVHEAAETRLVEYSLGGEASDYDTEGNE
jgi:iron-sulfur cluster repair protein YtfE (RIC family)